MSAASLLVAGAGAAGLSAGLAAAMGGAEVVLIERSRHFRSGSNTSMSTAMIPAGGSRWQESHGIADSPELFYSDIVAATSGSVSTELALALTRVAPELVAWLSDFCDMPLNLVTDFKYPGHSVARCHSVSDRSGRSMHGHLIDAMSRNENITFLNPMSLLEIREAGASLEARIGTPDGKDEWAQFDAIVLATNGFAANKELVARYIPEMAQAYYHGGDGSTGDAIALGSKLGADLGFLDAYQGHGSVALPQRIILTWAVMMHGGILVNSAGRRFADESGSYSSFGAKTLAQKDGIGWAILDRRIDELCRSFADYQDVRFSGAVHTARTIEELALLIGCDSAILGEEIALATECALGHKVDHLGRSYFEAPLEPPFSAIKITGALFHTQGGLVVDGDGRVQRNRAAIPGLYAAGGAATGISGHGSGGYLAGNGLLAALGLGYLVGKHATSNHENSSGV